MGKEGHHQAICGPSGKRKLAYSEVRGTEQKKNLNGGTSTCNFSLQASYGCTCNFPTLRQSKIQDDSANHVALSISADFI